MCVAGFELSTACMATGRPEAAAKQTKQRWRKKLHSEQQQRARKDNQRGGGARVRFGDGRIRVMEQRQRERERDRVWHRSGDDGGHYLSGFRGGIVSKQQQRKARERWFRKEGLKGNLIILGCRLTDHWWSITVLISVVSGKSLFLCISFSLVAITLAFLSIL
jgi:hypothetical protein